ncbi:holo-ACP synthase AcpS [Patulibacter defluvii]|uniref:holo-ACP synthase AcpS n=1 Tax=Patulibacter defluvii TaxID=3095358 RepID=UPI002A7569E2|nr:holo-ACP synthase [Patulibacter sp. DM4]
MTVVGLGLDVVDVAGFRAQLDLPGSGFVAATFTAAEQRAAATGAGETALRLAARFAAKEAFVKAWSAARRGRPPALAAVDLRQIEVVDDGFGRPALRFHGAVAAALTALATEHGGPPVAHLSLSHDGPVAAATVVLDVAPERLGAAPGSTR